nr:hypothetical protein K-LCC10_0305 [Kaumoebavirus]
MEDLPCLMSIAEVKLAESVELAVKMGPPSRRDTRKKLKKLSKELAPDYAGDSWRLTDEILTALETRSEMLLKRHNDILLILGYL